MVSLWVQNCDTHLGLFYRSPELIALLLSSDGKFQSLPASISLAASPWSCAFDWLDRLWVCLPYHQGPVECLRYNNGAVILHDPIRRSSYYITYTVSVLAI